MSMSASTLINKKISRNSTSNTDYDGGAAKPNGLCLYHRAKDGSQDATYEIVGVMDFEYNKNKGYYKSDETQNQTVAELVYSIYKAYEERHVGYDGGSKNSVYAAFFKAVANGTISPPSSFTKSNGAANQRFSDHSYSISDEAQEYGETIKKYKKLKKNDSNNVNVNASGNYYILGPFNIDYDGAKISEIIIKGGNKTISASKQWSTSTSGSWSSDLKKLPKKQNFYIRIQTDATYATYSITFKQEKISFYNARLILLHGKANGDQQTGIFAATKEDVTNSISYTASYSKTLYIEKKDDKGTIRQGAMFKLYTSSGWITGSEGSYSYTTYSKAQEYKGNTPINGLPPRLYIIYETTPPTGLKLEDQPNYDASNKRAKCGQINLKTSNQERVTFTVTNVTDGKKGSITINKVDAKDPDIGLKAQFEVVSSKGEVVATVWSTGGSVTVSNLPIGVTYTIREITPPTGYRGAGGSKNVTLTKSKPNNSVTFENIKESTTDENSSIRVRKIDADGSRKRNSRCTI